MASVGIMPKGDAPSCLRRRFQDDAAEQLAQAGRSPEVAEALLALDRALFLWQRRARKGELPGLLLRELGTDLELAQFPPLTGVIHVEGGLGDERSKPAAVGHLAEELSLGPWRARRIAGDLVPKGFVRREAVQGDGRRTVLRLTEQARAVGAILRGRKWAKLLVALLDWWDQGVRTFAAPVELYREGMTRACGG